MTGQLGASVATNLIENTVEAKLENSSVDAYSVEVRAVQSASVLSVAIGMSGGGSGGAGGGIQASGAGSILVNTQRNKTTALVDGGTIRVVGGLEVKADDQSELKAYGGGASGGGAGGAGGGGVALS